MAALSAILLAAAFVPAAPARVGDWHTLSSEAARRFHLPVAWIERVMQAESAGRLTLRGRPIVSRAGAMGLMQLMPATWASLRLTLRLGADPFDPRDNILAGAAYLRLLYDRFGYPGLFAAYNAGPARYAAFLDGHGSLPRETQTYLAALGLSPQRPPPTSNAARAAIFFVSHDARPDLPVAVPDAAPAARRMPGAPKPRQTPFARLEP